MAKNIMIQGTMSNAGKSILCAGLCRIFRQDGYRVAPFKSQNMALNSFITAAGGEMGRAQVVQAEAAGIAPDVRMNPILLKPTTDVGSQVIVNGVVQGNMHAMEYYRRKREYIPAVMEAYNSLAAENDIIVIEGAGSPAEINLKQEDIVNMGLAKLVDAPVLLVGDIDRGGVFAQLYGTVALLEPDERARIRGTIVNKFRGDKKILEPGLKTLEELCGVPVAGVVPYVHLDIDDEDSLSTRFDRGSERRAIDIAVVRLPRISNFTDVSPFERYENVSVRYIERAAELGAPDMIVLPGTKSTIADLKWLRESGLEAAILKAADGGTLVFGICGGYQMLGRSVSDPEQVEAAGGHRRRDDLVQLDGDALARDDADALAVAPDRGEGFGQDVETELRGEAHGPHHAQRIVRKGDVGVARRADDPLVQIAQPLERIDQLAEGVAVERPRQRVDREIAAELVVFERPLLHGGLARIGRIGLLACADELDFHTSGAQHRRAEGLEDRQTRMQFGGQRFGHGDPAPHDHHVDVRRRTPQIIVAHVTAHHVGAHAHRIRKARDAAENRIGKRIAAVVAHRCRQRL